RTVAGGQYETVAVGPGGIRGVEFQELREQDRRHVGRAHRQTGMAGLRLLDSVHREPADRIGHTGGIDLRHGENPSEMRCLVVMRSTGRGKVATRAQGWIAPWFRESN